MHLDYRLLPDFRRDYSIFRMRLAIERMLSSSTTVEELQARKWATAWAHVAVTPQNWRPRYSGLAMREAISKASRDDADQEDS
jgi:hypothetical protein